MKKPMIFFIFLFASAYIAFAAIEMKYGSLNVISKSPGVTIYVDGVEKGRDLVQIKEIQAGTHFIKVTSVVTADAQKGTTAEVTVYAEVVEVRAGELTTLVISEKGAQEPKRAKPSEDEVDVFKTKRILDYSREMHTGWYIRAEYLTNLYYNYDSISLDNYASSLAPCLGFKIPLAPNIDFTMELERAEFNSSKEKWYFMPLTANVQLSYLPSPYFRGKQYFGLGIGYYMTDLETSYNQNLTALGYHLFYGLEMPSGDQNAFFFEFGYHMADISRYSYNLNAAYASVGYRWDVKE